MVAHIGEYSGDGGKGATLVVGCQLLDILEQYGGGAVMFQDACHFEEHGLTYVFKSLHFAHNAECLAGESGQQQVVRWNLFRSYLCNVSGWAFSEIGLVGVGSRLVPFGREHALVSQFFEWQPYASNTGE